MQTSISRLKAEMSNEASHTGLRSIPLEPAATSAYVLVMFVEWSLFSLAVWAFGCAFMPRLRPVRFRMLASPLGSLLLAVELLASLPASASPSPPALRLLDTSEGAQEPDTEPRESADVEREPRFYRVVPGDSLWAIACRELGSGTNEEIDRRWREIYTVNRHVIGTNPNLIFPGQMLSLPESVDG